jgi:hypothetical protein
LWVTPGTVDSLGIEDREVVVPAGEERLMAMPAQLYADPADGQLASVEYSDETDVTVAVFRV